MKWKPILLVLSNLSLILALCLLGPLYTSVYHYVPQSKDFGEIRAFLETILIVLVIGLIFRYLSKGMRYGIGRREGFAIVSFSWLLAVVLGMLPYLFSGTTENISDAFFETMSGFTTTGASIFGSTGREIELLGKGIQFWRCMTQWLGGMGIVVLSVALLSFLGVGGIFPLQFHFFIYWLLTINVKY